jgi:hypothetical protein
MGVAVRVQAELYGLAPKKSNMKHFTIPGEKR